MPQRLSILLWIVLAAGLCAACAEAPEPGGELSFLFDRERWRATSASAVVERVEAAGGGVEWSIQIVARRDPEGEQITLFAVAPEIVGTHPVRAFGTMRGFPAQPNAPTPVTNVCGTSAASRSAASPDGATGDDAQAESGDNRAIGAGGTLSIESHDPDAGTISGSFLVNVCDVQNPSDGETLGDGRFVGLAYP